MKLTQCTLLGLVIGFLVSGCSGAPKASPAVAVAPSAKPVAIDPNLWRSTRPEPGPARSADYPVSVEKRLPNGLKLYFVRRAAPIASLEVVMQGGAATVPVGKSGLAALTARMLTEGTTKKTALDLAVAAESLGSALNDNAERDAISVSMEVLPRDVPAALALLAEVIRTPAFRPADLQRVKAEWKDQLLAERQNPVRLASLATLRTVLGPGLGAPVSGSEADIAKLTRADLVTWHHSQVVPGNTALIAVGDLDAELVTQQATELFGKWTAPAPKISPPPVVPAAQGTRILLIDRPGSVQSAIFAAHPFPKRSEPGHEAREVLNSLFGGLFTSRLNMNLREQHAYSYGARSMVVGARNFGLFAISTSVERDVTAESIQQILYELKALKDSELKRPILPEEIQRAKADLSHDLGASLEHTGRIADNVATQFIHGLPPDYHARYGSVLEALDRTLIEQVAQSINPAALTFVVVGDRSAIEAKITALGLPIETARATLIE